MEPTHRQSRSIFAGVGVITLLSILVVVGFSLFLQQRCTSAFWDEMLVYPGAERIEEESAFLGVQRVVYHSPDAPANVERWYITQNAAQMRDAVVSGDFGEVPARQSWVVEPDAERGGSLMWAKTTCP
jgi:hypothetical protein